jgi:hypothetical protein
MKAFSSSDSSEEESKDLPNIPNQADNSMFENLKLKGTLVKCF